MRIKEQDRVLENDKKNMLVSASAGSGKTYIMIKYISQLICDKKIPIKNFLVLTFTKAAATEMKERLQKRLKEQEPSDFVIEQIDALSTSNISTIHAFCEKCLKKYANLLNISESFQIADENKSQKIRKDAFEKAINIYSKNFQADYNILMAFYKNNKNKIRDILFEIEVLTNSIADKEHFLNENLNFSENYFDKSIKFLHQNFLSDLKLSLAEVEKLHINDFCFELEQSLNLPLKSSDLFEMAKACQAFKFPTLPKRKEVGDEVVNKLNVIKYNITNKILAKLKELNLLDDENIEFQKAGKLEKNILSLFNIYENEENLLKKSQNLLDFYDLEKYMKILSTKENLFDGLKYVFVDEYQDTNKVQELIIKNIAKNCNFVAVGDVKQGIYGFRNASSEIFLKDIENFEVDENSSVNYLKSNFRSSQKVLDFVNDVFKVCMTKEITGVDYQNSSMLKGMSGFVDDGQKAVTIDLVKEKQQEKEELPQIYSVKNANVRVENRNENMLFAIAKRLVEVLETKISVDEKLRPCRYSDIAILSRGRNDLFNQLENFLQKIGIPVASTSRNTLTEQPEILMLINYLKIALNLDDDIALLSVLMSDLSEINLSEILDEKIATEKSLCKTILDSKNKKINKFLKNLQKFRKNALIFGIKKAFLELFNATNYRAYINLKPNYSTLNTFIDKFLNEISASEYEFDLAGLINYFETVSITVNSDNAAVEDAVTMTTIHNSKGLEYPIVFLIGCDVGLKNTFSKADVETNEKYGLALKFFDTQNNKEAMSVKMRAIREEEAKKDFVEELMIFYVALTRAKNRMYLFGAQKEYKKFTLQDCDCYYDLIFYALQQETTDFEDEKIQICNIDLLEETDIGQKQNFENAGVSSEVLDRVQDYLDFEYKFDELTNFRLKESVTSLNQKILEDKLEKYSNENFSFGGAGVDIGNAYHLSLKVIDFEKVCDLSSLKEQIKKHSEILSSSKHLIDEQILLENILILKKFSDGAKVFKEKEFVLKDSIKNLLSQYDFGDEILVQGVIDFFAIKDGEVVLIDYKYSNSDNDNYLLNKYTNQLKTYKIALENALKIKVNKVFLLSLRNHRLIKAKI